MEPSHRLHRKYFKDLRAVVKQAINNADPVRLLAIGAPDDEYDPEVGTILPRLRNASSAADVQAIIYEEFVRWFGEQLAGRAELYEPAAERIWGFLIRNSN